VTIRTEPLAPAHLGPTDPELTRRALAHVRGNTTQLAETTLRVPLAYYRSPALLAREDTLLRRTPLALLTSSEVANAGDFVVRDVLGTSVLITRGRDGVVRALLNYCRHRGARPASGCGNAQRFTCPYHAWTYGSDGALLAMPGGGGFTDVARKSAGLVALRCEERHGLVWVVLTAGAPLDLTAHLGPLDAELAGWGVDGYAHLTAREFTSDVSWKAGLEAFAESYHFPYVHGGSIVGESTIADVALHAALGPHGRVCFPTVFIRQHDAGESSLTPVDNMAIIYWVFPNLVMAFTPVGVEMIDILPAGSPTKCTVRHGWMAKGPWQTAEERAGYESLYELVHAAVRGEDFGMLPQCGEGIRQGQHEHMLIGRNEIGVQHVVRTFAAALGLASTENAIVVDGELAPARGPTAG